MIAWSAVVLAVIAVVSAAKSGGAIIAPTVLAGLFALTLAPVVDVLERPGVPVSLAAVAVVAVVVVGTIGAIYLLAPSAEEWRMRAPSIMRSLEWHLRDIEREIEKGVEKATAGRAEDLGGQQPASSCSLCSSSSPFRAGTRDARDGSWRRGRHGLPGPLARTQALSPAGLWRAARARNEDGASCVNR